MPVAAQEEVIRMVDWICSVPLTQLSQGLERVAVGRSADPRSALHGTHFHALHRNTGSTIHLIGSDGPDRGAICHVKGTALGTDSSYRCVLPGDLQSRIVAEFSPTEVLRLGTRKRGDELVVEGVVDSRQLVVPVRPGWGTLGLACFADAGFTNVEPGVYWVKGGVRPLIHPHQALAQVSAAVEDTEIFVEEDFDGYDDELVPGKSAEYIAAAPPSAAPPSAAPGPAAPAPQPVPRTPHRIRPLSPAPVIQVTPPTAFPMRTKKSPDRQPAKTATNERVANPNTRGERTR